MISTPVIYENKVYIANGQDPEHGEGVGHLYAIDATKRGGICSRKTRSWPADLPRPTLTSGTDELEGEFLRAAATCVGDQARYRPMGMRER